MKLIERLKQDKPSLSFEVFPPKTSDSYDSVLRAVTEIADLKPDYMSVTYGAGGGTSAYTTALAEEVNRHGVTALAHLTCVCAGAGDIPKHLDELRAHGIENILALRGDMPAGTERENLTYHYASELISEIREYGGFCIGGACYPECHPESENSRADIEHLKIKVDCGCEFLTTQMFFDNDIYYNFLWRLLKAGVDVPVIPGIMPVTSAKQIKRICGISGNSLPQKFLRIVDRYGDNPEAMKQAGIAFATEQIIDLLANGVNAVHIYSMNHPDVARAIRDNISAVLA